MFKKLSVLALCLILTTAIGCTKKNDSLTMDKGSEPEKTNSEPITITETNTIKNPLTGLDDIQKEKAKDRPVAITINNLSTAQPVQTGLNKADIVFETEVEGGITRLLAVFQDVTKAEKIGSIRSARYYFVDLALGLNAIFLHKGTDPTYCKPHLNDIDDIDNETRYCVRIPNGLISEHTLYTYGEKLWNNIVDDGVKTENSNVHSFANFADAETPITFENTATSVSVPFSTSYKTTFKYDEEKALYKRYFNNTVRTDYFTKETVNFKNVFVLLTSISNYSDNHHRQVSLQSGNGYYACNGTYKAIKWSKGSSKNSFKFTNEDGSELTVNPGNSWVMIADSSTSQPIFE